MTKVSRKHIDAARVRQRFTYNSVDGLLIWLRRPSSEFKRLRDCNAWNTNFAGKVAGCFDDKGYRIITLDLIQYKAHRLIWVYLHGYMPDEVDHIDGDKSNNRPDNLRDVSRLENGRNTAMYQTNSSGVTGVRSVKDGSAWRAYIKVNGQLNDLGYFKDFDEAVSVRKGAEIECDFHPNHGDPLRPMNGVRP